MNIHHATPSDLPEIVHLLRSNELPIDDLTAASLTHFAVARSANGGISGCIGLEVHDGAGLLRSLAVSSEMRGEGVGDALVRWALQRAHELGLTHVYLLTTTARDYFAARGFKTVDRGTAPTAIRETCEFTSLCPATATFMMTTA